jgi:integrase/recombinase XerD
MTEMSPLRRRMIEDMTVRNLSPATQRSYVHAVAKFGRFFGRSPDKLDLEDVRTFQVHLVAGGISWPALNQIVCALRFLYGVTLRQSDLPERIPYAREPQKLPVVLGADEVVCFLEAVPSLKSVQSGFNEVAIRALGIVRAARPHRSLQIPKSAGM